MESFLKVTGASIFLITIVVVPITLISLLFLYLTWEKPEAKDSQGVYITLTSYQGEEEDPNVSLVDQEVLIDCASNESLCQDIDKSIEEAREESCSGSENPRILVQSNQGEGKMIASDCSVYQDLLSNFTRAEE